jgi:hypothetical protein
MTKKMGCKSHIKLSVIRNAQLLVINEMEAKHNHVVSKVEFAHYIQNRAMKRADEATKTQVEEMIKAKANPRLILNFLTEKTESLEDVKAIHNFKRNLKLRGEI